MNRTSHLATVLSTLTLACLLAACGGGDADGVTANEGTAHVLKGGGGGGGGGGTKPPPATTVSPLPTSAPAVGVLVRESFGMGPDNLRPASGKGDLRDVYASTTIGGFWVEWPGSKNTAWMTPDGTQTWKFCGTSPSPYELPSPLQGDESNGFRNAGCAVSIWSADDLPTLHPTALVPFVPPATAWAMSMEGYPSAAPGAYVAIGLTNSAVTMSNLETVGQVWLSLRKQEALVPSGPVVYELRLNGRTGTLLATGVAVDLTWNHMVISYDPVSQVLSASLNGVSLGQYPMDLGEPTYAGFEGVGILDNFVIREIDNSAL